MHSGSDVSGDGIRFIQRFRYFFHHQPAFFHSVNGAFNQFLCSFGGFIRFGRQIANFIGNNGEALTGTACAGSLDSGIQSQNICLERNAFNGINDFTDFGGRAGNFLHGGIQLFYIIYVDT